MTSKTFFEMTLAKPVLYAPEEQGYMLETALMPTCEIYPNVKLKTSHKLIYDETDCYPTVLLSRLTFTIIMHVQVCV